MRALRFRRAARRDVVEIARFIRERSQSEDAARRVRDAILRRCARLAELKAIMGRPRSELRQGLRSVPFKSYVIFFAYPADGTFEVSRILHGSRDLTTAFAEDTD
ncbi:MAG: type II toxin-antitoxin system RelE/ParE family toxin [Hyphomonadaceae bacterium]|nr:type II toxin-antitoxin system RelE/ParE family toxin [Hyphomonadaceae bacterium]